MSDSNSIGRDEIAQLLGISLTKLLNVINHSTITVPAPVGRERTRLVYDREVILAWIETKPLESLTWLYRPKKAAVNDQINDQARAFLSGRLGVSKAQQHKNQLRRIIAKQAQVKTQRVEIRGGAYDMGGDRRSARHQRKAQ